MGSRPSRSKVKAVEGAEQSSGKVVAPPAQKQTASAPPTPQHPEGTPRPGATSPFDEFPGPPSQDQTDHVLARAVTLTDAWMPGPCSASSSSLRDGPVAAEQAMDLPGMPQDDGYPAELAAGGYAAAAEAPPPAPGIVSAAPQPVVETEPRPATGKRAVPVEVNELDVPLEEVLKAATEAFGSSIATALSSTKWDRRVEALKGVATVLKSLDIKASGTGPMGEANPGGARGLQLRDHARCFNAACLILHIVMRDKVLPVLLSAHDLYRVTFEHGRATVTEAEALRAAKALFSHSLAKLGELNIKLHDSACACVLFTASQPFFGISLTLARLVDVVEGRGPHQASALRGPQKMRVHYGVLQAVEMLIKQSPGRREGEGDAADTATSWTPADLTPFIVGGLQADSVTGARVQQAALGLAMNLYMTLGKAAILPLLEQLNPAAKDILVTRLEEEGEDLEDVDGADGDEDCIELSGADGFCVMGVGLRPPTESLPVSKPNTTDNEECLMDEILEDTGLVFGGQDLVKKQMPRSALDEELTGLGLNEEELDLIR